MVPAVSVELSLNWNHPKNDLRLTVTNTCGETFVADGHALQSYEVVAVDGVICGGDWTITVEYGGRGSVKYTGWTRFFESTP